MTFSRWIPPFLVLCVACGGTVSAPDGSLAEEDGGHTDDAGHAADAALNDAGVTDAGGGGGTDAGDDGGMTDAGDDGGADGGSDISTAVCGNGILEAGEVCDDGNTEPDDGCDPTCSSASCLVPVTHATVADGVADGDCPTVWVMPGIYTENVVIERDMTLTATGTEPVILDGDAAGTVVTVAAGGEVTLHALELRNGLAEFGGCVVNHGTLTLTQALIRDCVARAPVARGGAIYSDGPSLTLEGTAVRTNLADSSGPSGDDDDGSPAAAGGGIWASGGAVRLTADSVVEENEARVSGFAQARSSGGGVFLAGGSLALLDGSTLLDNTALAVGTDGADALGGGIAASGGTTTCDGGFLLSNSARATGGGGFAQGGALHTTTTFDFTECVVSNNRAEAEAATGGATAHGGALLVSRLGGTIRRCEVLGNIADAEGPSATAQGGVAYGSTGTSGVGVILVEDSLVQANQALATGEASGSHLARGGAFSVRGGTGSAPGPELAVRLERTLVAGNRAEGRGAAAGGAFYGSSATGSARARLIAINSTLSGNSAVSSHGGASGGAVALETSTGSARAIVELINATVTDNLANGATSARGGALFLDRGISSSVTEGFVRNSIVYANTATTSPDCILTDGARLTSDGYNVLGDLTGCSTTAGAAPDTDLIGVDPLLSALADNGGFTETHALAAESPAVDGGNPGGCASPDGTVLEVDQRGEPRPGVVGGRCDIGAFERQP